MAVWLALTVSSAASTDTITLHVFVMVPAARVTAGLLNGYRIGAYPSKPLNENPIYRPPAGFVEISKANRDHEGLAALHADAVHLHGRRDEPVRHESQMAGLITCPR